MSEETTEFVPDPRYVAPQPSAKDFQTLELLVQELQNRIGQITSQYETNLAMLKAQATQEIQAREQRIQELQVSVQKAN
jgi:hypothetical protein